MSRLGDAHNFGRSVLRDGDWMIKPRPLFWEWLFLNQNSPLRKKIDHRAIQTNFISPFSWFPQLHFAFDDRAELKSSGKVEYFFQQSINDLEPVELAKGFGACIANCLFWGITDVHSENIAFGICPKTSNHVIFPLDIETVFYHYVAPSQAYLLKSKKNETQTIGAKSILEIELSMPVIIKSFLNVINFYSLNLDFTKQVFQEMPIKTYPIRCILKHTRDYDAALTDLNFNQTFFKEELIQLRRGDIPYFYTYLDSGVVFYLTEHGETSICLPWEEAFAPLKEKIPSLKNIGYSLNDTSINFAILQIARTFAPNFNTLQEADGIKVLVEDDNIFINIEEKKKISCKKLANS